MTSLGLLERARASFQPRYEVQRELGRGVTGAVFLANDLSLKRRVAIKVLFPELASESVSRRFDRETRILASLNHPNVVAIHETGESDGLRYYVRDFLEGEPLSALLARGRMTPADATQLCRDLLSALGASHACGVIHRDLRPANIFCLEDRYVLADFEIAKSRRTSSASGATTEEQPRSTDYAAPEQLSGGEVGPAADLYAVGAVVYQALTGARWGSEVVRKFWRWRRVPRWFRGPLLRALAPSVNDRWRDAEEFRAAVDSAANSARARRRRSYAAAILIVPALYLANRGRAGPHALGAPPRQLAILPFESEGNPVDDSLAVGLSLLVQMNLDNLPGLSLTPTRQVKRWWDEHDGTLIGIDKANAARDLKVHWLAHGTLEHQSDSLRIRLTVYDSGGRKLPITEVRARASDLGAVGDTLAISLVTAIAPHLAQAYRVIGDLGGVSFAAQREFLRGEASFQQDQWSLAERHFERALDLDSTFALAAWRLANVKRWRRLPYENDLRKLFERGDARLRPLDRELIVVLNDSSIRSRLARLDSVITMFPEDAYARLLFAEELFHRGPLVGEGLDEGTRGMNAAVAHDSSMALAYDHLIFAAIRQGRRRDAKSALASRREVGIERSPGDPDILPLAELAYDERFVPWRAWIKRHYLRWTADSAQVDGLGRVFRTAVPWSDIPESQIALSDLLGLLQPDSGDWAGIHEGKAIGLMTLGRPSQALKEADSAAVLFRSDAARLEQSEWHIVLPALGLPLPRDTEWEMRLARLADHPALASRAFWALSLAAFANSDTAEGGSWMRKIPTAGNAGPLHRFLQAVSLASHEDWQGALLLSDSLEVDLNATDPPDPFARATFHLYRGRWFAAAGNSRAADREWLWYEGSDIEGWPQGLAQAGEIDGMLGVYARLLRGDALLRHNRSGPERKRGCDFLERVAELWRHSEPAFASLKAGADSLLQLCSG